MTTSNNQIFILTLIFSVSLQVNAQISQPEILKKLNSLDLPDTSRVNLLNDLSKSIFGTNLDSSLVVATDSRKLAEQVGYKKGLAIALKTIGRVYYNRGNYFDAIKNWQLALDAFKIAGDNAGVANMLSNQGAVYFNQGDDSKSLELHLQSLKISEELDDTLRVVTSLTNIGTIYLNKETTYDKALDYFLRAHKLALIIKDPYSIGMSAGNLGETYYKIGNDKLSLAYSTTSRDAYEDMADKVYPMLYIGRVFTKQKQYDQAIKTLTDAYEIASKESMPLDMAQSQIALAQTYYAKGDVTSAIAAYKKSFEQSLPMKSLPDIRDAYEGLAQAYSQKSDYNNAFKYQQLLTGIKDTINNSTTGNKIAFQQLNFDLDKKGSEVVLLNKNRQIQQQEIRRQKLVRNGFIGGFAAVLSFAGLVLLQRNRIRKEKRRSDELMLNILPADTAEELKATGTAKAKSFESVTVLFTDFKNFTQASELLTPEELVAEISHCYSEFDRIVTKYNIEKIKTIGDSYMCAGGLPVTNDTHPFDVIAAGLEMVDFIERNKKERIAKGQPYFELRCGIHTGPVVAGIVGIKKFAYDIWGDTVNTASRMESSGETGRVNISGTTYEIVKDKFACTPRGKLQAKNKGLIEMYFVEGVSMKVIQERRYHLL